ncbi:hypothetical protein [uncultured Nevskia sp.]|uniref:hypothetical protein n=1 Tax=uncultured Nevskia sp. TaxID=228950 RepID=UPI0025F0C0D7|nr:hypothetical protein [uncultured Nevskia sp.]
MNNFVIKLGSPLALLLPLLSQAQTALAPTQIKEPTHPLLWLALLTLGIGLFWVLWQVFKVRKAKRENVHSSLSRGNIKTEPRD